MDEQSHDEGALPQQEEGSQKGVESPMEEGEQRPPITLDRYLSRRKPRPQAPWPQFVALGGMILALILIFGLKDRCGTAVSNVVDKLDPPAAQE